MSFYGTYYHQMDAKNRIRIPAKFKSAFPQGEQLYFFKHRENCFAVMPESSLNKMMSIYEDVNPFADNVDEDQQDGMTAIYGLIADLDEDNQGRVNIPKLFREAAGLSAEETNVVSVGHGSFIEVWSQSAYEHRIANKSLSQAKAAAQAKKAKENE